MDAEHRHELKTNELADFLGHLPDFIRKYSNQIIGVILILIALVVIPLYTRMRKQAALAEEAAVITKIQMARESLNAAAMGAEDTNPAAALTTASDDLNQAAQTTDHADLAALALLEESELLRAKLHVQSDVTPDTISEILSKARTACEQAFEKAQSPTLKGLAELGLGLCAEEAGEYDKAREIYTKITAAPQYVGTSVIEQAQRRMDALDENSRKVTFVNVQEELQPEMTSESWPAADLTLPSMRADDTMTPTAPANESTDTAAP